MREQIADQVMQVGTLRWRDDWLARQTGSLAGCTMGFPIRS